MALKSVGSKDQRTSRAFKDIAMAFGKNPFTDDINAVKNDNSIKSAIKNLVLTTPGEKPFQPLVGSRVNDLLFEHLEKPNKNFFTRCVKMIQAATNYTDEEIKREVVEMMIDRVKENIDYMLRTEEVA